MAVKITIVAKLQSILFIFSQEDFITGPDQCQRIISPDGTETHLLFSCMAYNKKTGIAACF